MGNYRLVSLILLPRKTMDPVFIEAMKDRMVIGAGGGGWKPVWIYQVQTWPDCPNRSLWWNNSAYRWEKSRASLFFCQGFLHGLPCSQFREVWFELADDKLRRNLTGTFSSKQQSSTMLTIFSGIPHESIQEQNCLTSLLTSSMMEWSGIFARLQMISNEGRGAGDHDGYSEGFNRWGNRLT